MPAENIGALDCGVVIPLEPWFKIEKPAMLAALRARPMVEPSTLSPEVGIAS